MWRYWAQEWHQDHCFCRASFGGGRERDGLWMSRMKQEAGGGGKGKQNLESSVHVPLDKWHHATCHMPHATKNTKHKIVKARWFSSCAMASLYRFLIWMGNVVEMEFYPQKNNSPCQTEVFASVSSFYSHTFSLGINQLPHASMQTTPNPPFFVSIFILSHAMILLPPIQPSAPSCL